MADVWEWRPGSFTKNYGWGAPADGLKQLYDTIRIGFDGQLVDVPREVFRNRIQRVQRPDYIPMNFFLFNRPIGGVDHIIADELVFQALIEDHGPGFDKLALFAFVLSYVGHWRGAANYQRRPALWAHHYVRDRVAPVFNWRIDEVSADDIEHFVESDPRYVAQGARKLATNLNYLFKIGRLREFGSEKVERWWVDALYLTLDRIIEDRALDQVQTVDSQHLTLLSNSGFKEIAGRPSLAKQLAAKHLVTLYTACGGRGRFSEDIVRDRTMALPDVQWLLANSDDPQAAIHRTNPEIIKSIPRSCAILARYYGFDVIDLKELDNFDAADFVKRHNRQALESLKRKGATPTMSVDEHRKLTRGQ